jgi:hypothetical protein
MTSIEHISNLVNPMMKESHHPIDTTLLMKSNREYYLCADENVLFQKTLNARRSFLIWLNQEILEILPLADFDSNAGHNTRENNTRENNTKKKVVKTVCFKFQQN